MKQLQNEKCELARLTWRVLQFHTQSSEVAPTAPACNPGDGSVAHFIVQAYSLYLVSDNVSRLSLGSSRIYEHLARSRRDVASRKLQFFTERQTAVDGRLLT